jgi:hypothetical protein
MSEKKCDEKVMSELTGSTRHFFITFREEYTTSPGAKVNPHVECKYNGGASHFHHFFNTFPSLFTFSSRFHHFFITFRGQVRIPVRLFFITLREEYTTQRRNITFSSLFHDNGFAATRTSQLSQSG